MTDKRPIRVFAVDDHPLMLEGIASVLEGEDDIVLVGEASNGQEAVEKYAKCRAHVTVMDLKMPLMNGVDAMEIIRRDFSDARFIALTTYQGDIQALRALKAGASGYLLKNKIRSNLIDAIRAVHEGKRYIPPDVAAELAEHVAQENLTEREIEVLRNVAVGRANKAIASRLSISEPTVKKHLKSIMEKLGANDRTHAVTIAMKRGFLDLS
jgi:DNA-binding NarL/FixJ family response regulator